MIREDIWHDLQYVIVGGVRRTPTSIIEEISVPSERGNLSRAQVTVRINLPDGTQVILEFQ